MEFSAQDNLELSHGISRLLPECHGISVTCVNMVIAQLKSRAGHLLHFYFLRQIKKGDNLLHRGDQNVHLQSDIVRLSLAEITCAAVSICY